MGRSPDADTGGIGVSLGPPSSCWLGPSVCVYREACALRKCFSKRSAGNYQGRSHFSCWTLRPRKNS